MRFSSFMLAVMVSVCALAASGSARASLDVQLPAEGAIFMDHGSALGTGQNVFHDLQHGCGVGHVTTPIPGFTSYLVINADGSFVGACTIDQNGVHDTGTASGNINLQTGDVSFTFSTTERIDAQARTIHISYEGTGTLNAGFQNYAAGTANYTYDCKGDDPDATCEPLDDISGGTLNWSMSFYPLGETDFTVDHIELVQTVQDEDNTVPPVAGKSAIVRVFARSTLPFSSVTIKLSAGDIVLGEATTISGPGISRETKDTSANFLLPGSSLHGSLSLTADVSPPDNVTDADTTNNTKTQNFTFQDRNGLFVDYIKVCSQPGGVGQPNCPHDPNGDIPKAAQFANDVFPLADDALIYDRIVTPVWIYTDPLNTPEDESKFIAALRMRYDFMSNDQTVTKSLADQVIAWLPSGLAIEGGAADPKWFGGLGRTAYLQFDPNIGIGTQVALAHEIAHNLGRHHPKPTVEACGATDDKSDWPYSDASIQEPGYWLRRDMLMPSSDTDLMTYCDNRWISTFTYERLFDGDFSPQSAAAGSASQNDIYLSGTVAANGASGTLNPAFVLPAASGQTDVPDPNGNACLLFSDDSGILDNFCFDLSFASSEGGPAFNRQAFSIKAPLPDGTKRVALLSGDIVLDSIEASAHAATVDITSPAATTTITGQATVSWTGSDADSSDSLTYTVLYSPDGGHSWIPLEVATTATQTTFATTDAAAGDHIMFRVIVSDGFNTTVQTSAPVLMSNTSAKGDADCNGTFGAPDVASTLGYLANAGAPACLASSDVNCDNQITVQDVLLMLKKLANFTLDLPPTCPF